MEVETSIPEKLAPLFEPKRYKVLYGGRGGGKSVTIGKALLIQGLQRKMRILCTREVQKSLADSVIKLLADLIEEMGLQEFYTVQKNVIKGSNGTEFLFAGLQAHTIDSLRSYVNIDAVWVEEAHSVSEKSWNVLIPTIRKPGSEIIASFNPDQETDYVYQRFVKGTDPSAWVCQVNYLDNPWFPEVLDAERLALRAINDDLYAHVWEGKCRSAAGLMFKRHWFQFYDVLPSHLNYYMASDYAVTPDDGDFTEHGVFGLTDAGDLYVVDWWYGQTDPAEWIDKWIELGAKYNPLAAFEEAGVILRAVTGAIDRRQRETGKFLNRVSLPSAGSKAERALGFAARASAGTVYLPKGEMGIRILNQLCAFNGEDGRQDDAVDVCSLVGRGIAMMAGGSPLAGQGERKLGRDYGLDDEDDDDRDNWKVA